MMQSGRVKTYEAIVKGENVPEPGVPEGFKVLIKELQSLGLDVRLLSPDNQELELKENIEDGIDFNSVEDSKKLEAVAEETVVDEGELSDGYTEDGEDIEGADDIDDLMDADDDSLFEGLDDEEVLLDDTDLGEDNLLNDQDILDDDNE